MIHVSPCFSFLIPPCACFDVLSAAGPEVHKTSKLFWKQDVSINISLRYCSDLDVITLQIQNVKTKEDYKTLCINKSDCAIDQEALEAAATLAVQSSDEKTDDGKELIRKNTYWEFYSNYLVARLQLNKDGDSYLPSLAKLYGDEYTTLEIEKPSNLKAPQRVFERQRSDGSLTDKFETKFKSLQRDIRSSRSSRKNSKDLSSVAEAVLSEILHEELTGI